MGRRFIALRQITRSDKADIAVAARLAPGPAILDLQHVEDLAEKELIELLSRRVGRPAQGGGGRHAAIGLSRGVGGGANQEQIENAFGILLSDPHVKAIFINIFGGILRVDVLAQGVVNAAKKLGVKIPIILRLEGTNVEEGRKILKDSGLNFQVGTTMKEAADLAVAAAKGKS